jgi:hypothetical protein
MSEYQNTHDDDGPRFEAWLGVSAGSLVPVIVALFAPPAFLVPLIATTALLFAAGLIMLRRQTAHRTRESGRAPVPSATSGAPSFDHERVEIDGGEP